MELVLTPVVRMGLQENTALPRKKCVHIHYNMTSSCWRDVIRMCQSCNLGCVSPPIPAPFMAEVAESA